jgi:phosphodiesterase/alkaline phosphatase D-like protein
VNGSDIALQPGAASGLWTHTAVDWAGNEGIAKPSGWPNNASQGDLGIGDGTRPGGAATQSYVPGGIIISNVNPTNITTTSAGITVTFSSTPTSSRVNYGTTQAVGSTAAGTTATTQTIALSGLTTNTVYYFSVQATDAQGTVVSNLGQFKTF